MPPPLAGEAAKELYERAHIYERNRVLHRSLSAPPKKWRDVALVCGAHLRLRKPWSRFARTGAASCAIRGEAQSHCAWRRRFADFPRSGLSEGESADPTNSVSKLSAVIAVASAFGDPFRVVLVRPRALRCRRPIGF